MWLFAKCIHVTWDIIENIFAATLQVTKRRERNVLQILNYSQLYLVPFWRSHSNSGIPSLSFSSFFCTVDFLLWCVYTASKRIVLRSSRYFGPSIMCAVSGAAVPFGSDANVFNTVVGGHKRRNSANITKLWKGNPSSAKIIWLGWNGLCPRVLSISFGGFPVFPIKHMIAGQLYLDTPFPQKRMD